MKRFTVLIPLDGSALSQRVLDTVGRLFDPQRYALLVLRVADTPAAVLAAPPRPLAVGNAWVDVYDSAHDFKRAQHPIYADQMAECDRSRLVDQLEREAQCLRDAGFDVKAIVRFGDPTEEIVAVAAEYHVELVAMATHSRSGLERLVMGSVAEAVLRRLAVPLLLHHPTEPDAE